MSEREEIGIVADQIGTPTYARDLAKAIMQIIEAPEFVQGVYHYSNEGEISWDEFATALNKIKGFITRVNAIVNDAFPTPAKRPNFSL